MAAIANPAIQDAVNNIAKEISESDVVVDPGADGGRTEMLTGSTGIFDWQTTKYLTGISSCQSEDDSITGLKMIFTDKDSGDTETKQLGSQDGLTCMSQQLEPNECVKYVSVDGGDQVQQMTFETSTGVRIIVGQGSNESNRWNTVNADNECLSGIYGVYKIVEEDVYQLLSIGFYFGDVAEENTGTVDGAT